MVPADYKVAVPEEYSNLPQLQVSQLVSRPANQAACRSVGPEAGWSDRQAGC